MIVGRAVHVEDEDALFEVPPRNNFNEQMLDLVGVTANVVYDKSELIGYQGTDASFSYLLTCVCCIAGY